MHTLSQYLTTLENPHGLVRRLSGFRLLRDPDGKPLFFLGNSAATFRIEWQGRAYALRCYLRPLRQDAETLYPGRLFRKELYLFASPEHGEWVDVVLLDWIEGENLAFWLHKAVERRDLSGLKRISEQFDRLAARLSSDEWALGDIKPENILVDRRLELHLIDRDAAFLPTCQGELSPELGTPAWQHPSRTAKLFDRTIDHYALAMLSVQIKALALDPSLLERHPSDEALLFSSEEVVNKEPPASYREVMDLLSRRGAARHYRLGELLGARLLPTEQIERLLSYATPLPAGLPMEEYPEFYMEWGLCGFRNVERVVIPPLYDEAFDFREGHAAVRLGREYHLINLRGESVWHREGITALKSLHKGRLRYRDAAGWHEEEL